MPHGAFGKCDADAYSVAAVRDAGACTSEPFLRCRRTESDAGGDARAPSGFSRLVSLTFNRESPRNCRRNGHASLFTFLM